MSTQITANPTSAKISAIYKKIKDGSLILQPPFQRKFVWSNFHKEKFIETILRGLPFPEIYMAQSGIDIDKIEASEVIVDGQQRLTTIKDYIDGLFIPSRSSKIKKYSELTESEKKDFLKYLIIIRDLGDIEPAEIKEIFRRINLTRYSLEQVEIHNAIYDGKFISTAKEIMAISSFSELEIFSDSEITRMADLLFILMVLSTIENESYFARDLEIEKFIIKFNDDYPSADLRKKRFIKVLKLIKELALKPDSLWLKKSNFFTMFVEFFKANIDYKMAAEIRKSLSDFEKHILANKDDDKLRNDFSKYYSYMYTGTNSRQARVLRGEMFYKFVLSDLLGDVVTV